MKIEGKVFVVTGAGSGIGRQVALDLLKRGAKVAAVDLRVEGLDELRVVTKDNKDLSTHVLNTTDRKAVEALPKDVISKQGHIDGLINNAGIIQPFVKINDLDYEAIDRVMNVNFYGTLYMTKAFLPYLLKRPEAHIVNVSSMGAFLPVPGQSVYGASKAAVKLMTEGLSAELHDTNIGVTVVFPGATTTNITKNSGVKIPALASSGSKGPKLSSQPPEKVASLIIKAIDKNQVRVFAGSDSKLMNTLYRISPSFATNFITRQMKSLLDK